MYAEKIKLIYKENSASKGGDFMGPLLFVLILVYVYGTLYSTVQNKLAKVNWSEQRCSPKYLFWSGFLAPTKDPMKETQKNFDRCVASSIYKDPDLYREIKKNESYIKKNEKEIRENAEKGKDGIDGIKERWEANVDQKELDVRKVKSEVGGIFEKQSYMHNEVSKRTTQMFHVLQSILIYVEGLLLYKVSTSKTNLNMNQTHLDYMDKYKDAYNYYNNAFNNLNRNDYTKAINDARISIKKFNKMSKELDAFMDEHFEDMVQITEGCYQLETNLEDKSCDNIFPNLNRDIIKFYPVIKSIR